MASIKSLIAILSYTIALCGVIPLFPLLGLFPRCIVVGGIAAGIWQDRSKVWPLKNWMFNASIIPVFVFYAAQFSRANPVQPLVSVLSIMLAVRLAGPKSSRHYLQGAVLSLFCLASSSLFDLSPAFLAYLALMLFMVAVLLVLLTFYNQDSCMTLHPADLRKVLAAGVLMPLVSLPLLIFFFPLLPRTQLPLWNFLATPATRSSGFSETVEPGRSPNIGESKVLVFRAEMLRQPQQQLYWRGTVFNRPEGNSWVRTGVPAEEIVYAGQRISQTIYPEPGSSRALLALDAPASVSQHRSRRSSDGIFELHGPSGKRLSYSAESRAAGILPVKGGINRSFYLKLPEKLSPRIRQLAASIRNQGSSDSDCLENLETFFRNGGYRYSRNGLPTGEKALEKFLFETRQGHCEFFASSFALLLRSAGVPSRVVGGYLGGEYNELGGYYLITEDLAHVWVEAYIEGRGWVRIDPSSFAQNADAIWGATRQRSLMLRVRMMLDSLDHSWNRAVVTYDFERQLEVALKTSKRLQGFETKTMMKSVLSYLTYSAVLAGLLTLLLYRKRLFLSREERLLRHFYRRIRLDCGIEVERGRAGMFELADRTANPAVREFADIYGGAVYRDRKFTEKEYDCLKLIIRNGFRKQLS
jgi:transglutaminase-like putative cysteine protease